MVCRVAVVDSSVVIQALFYDLFCFVRQQTSEERNNQNSCSRLSEDKATSSSLLQHRSYNVGTTL
jgi:hypothetical protein